jgi:hypothetical protein
MAGYRFPIVPVPYERGAGDDMGGSRECRAVEKKEDETAVLRERVSQGDDEAGR